MQSRWRRAANTCCELTTDKQTEDASYYCVDNTNCDTANGETCDLTSTSPTFHECIGRSCVSDNDCRACQTCGGTSVGVCGGAVTAACKTSGI